MIPDWETNEVVISDLLPQRHPGIVRRMRTVFKEHDVPLVIIPGTSDIWIRDYAPVQCKSREFVQFRYAPDYLSGQHARLLTGPNVFRGSSFIKTWHQSPLIVDGGNIVSDGRTAILTERVLAANRKWPRSEIEAELCSKLSVKKVILIPQEKHDVFGHADGMLRFTGPDRVVVNDYSQNDRALKNRLEGILSEHGIEVVRIPYRPSLQCTHGIPSAVGNYINFLRIGNLILIPSYRRNDDRVAHMILQREIPDAHVKAVPSRKLAGEGGVLQCVTWSIRQTISTSANSPAARS